MKDYVLNLDRTLFDVYLLTEFESNRKSANYRILIQNGIKIYCPYSNNSSFLAKIPRAIKNLFFSILPPKYEFLYKCWYVKRFIENIRPDVIHAHLKVLKFLAPNADLLRGCKLFYTCHNLPSRFFTNKDCVEEYDAAKKLINYGLKFVALHDEMRKEINRIFDVDSTIVLNNCIDLERFRNVNETKVKIRNEFHIPDSAFVIGHVGRFCSTKNQSYIVDIFNEVSKRNTNAYLLLVGNGDTTDVIDKLEKYNLLDKSLILSHRSDIPRLLKIFDVFVFPSLFEGLPISLIEAQAASLKCLISDRITQEVILSPNIVVEDIDVHPKIWADHILNSEERCMDYGDIENYSIQNVMQEVSKQYLE